MLDNNKVKQKSNALGGMPEKRLQKGLHKVNDAKLKQKPDEKSNFKRESTTPRKA